MTTERRFPSLLKRLSIRLPVRRTITGSVREATCKFTDHVL
jgi:hypothetical protein